MAFGDSILWGKNDNTRLHNRINNLAKVVETLKKSVSDGKILVANAITAFPGVTINEYNENLPTFNGMASALDSVEKHDDEVVTLSGTGENGEHLHSLPTGYWHGCTINAYSEYAAGQASMTPKGNAKANHVLSGKTFQSEKAGSSATGTMPNRGALNWSPTSAATFAVEPGYYSGGTLNSANAYNAGTADGMRGKFQYLGRITLSSDYADSVGSPYPILSGTTHLCFTKYGGNSQTSCYVGTPSNPKMYHFADATGAAVEGVTRVFFKDAHMYYVGKNAVTQVYGENCNETDKILYVDCYHYYG